ncbi:MAG: transcriptional repressor [Lachnospiraceae bacterium]|nr:transcriptional repressor [Lachnospiraceae bacterium]
MASVKYSRQRQSIREYLAGTREHPTADTVYAHMRRLYPNISLGTVYRNLNFLVEQGEAVRLTCGDGSERYDGDTSPHYHLRCRECGGIFDLTMGSLEHINTLAAADYDGGVEGHSVLFYGKCPECAHGKCSGRGEGVSGGGRRQNMQETQ